MLPADSRIGRYEIQRRVARGGMATLYLAVDPVLGRSVALKLFHGDLELPEAHERFVREARSAATLNHPNIVTVYDFGEYAEQPYIVMEFIEGETVAQMIRRQAPIPTITRLRWMEELCSAVEYAHARGIIHRDLKPLNLIVDVRGRLKVLDFGIARMRGTLASRTTAQIGTAGYMAPEQIHGGNIDHRSDLFSIGVVCYELLSYVEPFGAETEPAITNRILQEEPRPLPDIVPDVDPELAALVWTALRKDPETRFQDAESMRAGLAAVRLRLEALTADTIGGRQVESNPLAVSEPPGGARPKRLHDTDRLPRATPMPDNRAEREALVKKRTAQIRDSIHLARQLLEAGDRASARSQCEIVLALDRAHPEALELLQALDGQLAADAPTQLLYPGPLKLQRDSALPPEQEGSQSVRSRRDDDDTQSPLPGRKTPAAPPERRTPVDAPGISARDTLQKAPVARRSGPPAPSPRGPEDISSPARLKTPPPATPGPSTPSRVRGVLDKVRAGWREMSSRQRKLILAGASVSVLIALAGGIAWRSIHRPAPPVTTQSVLIDAVPWASVTKVVQRGTGKVWALPQDASTPLTLPLAAGNYDVSLQGPPPALELWNTTIEVVAGQPLKFPSHKFASISVDEYFETYLKQEAPAPQAPAKER